MRKGTTASGFSFEIDERNLDDMRFTDAFGALMDENASQAEKIMAQPVAFDMLLGKAQKKRLYDFIAEKNGGRRLIKCSLKYSRRPTKTQQKTDWPRLYGEAFPK